MSADQPGTSGGRLPLRTLLSYSSSMVGLLAVTTMVAVHLMYFYNTVVMLPAVIVGVVMALAQVWDAITDPLIGHLSDRTRWAWGRRRPYILLGSLPTAVFFFLVFSPPASFPRWGVAVFFTVAFLLFYTFRTVWDTPYCALAPELTLDYDERTRVSGYQQVFGTIGDVLGTMAPLVLVGLYLASVSPLFSARDLNDGSALAERLQDSHDPVSVHICERLSEGTRQLVEASPRGKPMPKPLRHAVAGDLSRLMQTGSVYEPHAFEHVELRKSTQDLLAEDPQGRKLVRLNRLLLEDAFPHGIRRQERTGWSGVGALIGVIALVSALLTYWGTRENPRLGKASELSLRGSLRATLRNRPYLLLVVTSTCTGMSNYTTIAVVQYAIDYWFRAPELKTWFFAAFFAGVFVAIPIWMRVTTRIGKKAAYIAAMAVYSAILWSIMVLPRGALVPFGCLMFVAGAFNIGLWLIAYSIVPDIIEWDQLSVGERREGAYYGIWTLMRKAAIGGAYIIIALVLTLVSFDQTVAEQAASALLGIRLLMGPIPSLLLILGLLIFLKFPITKQVHQDILRQLAEQREDEDAD